MSNYTAQEVEQYYASGHMDGPLSEFEADPPSDQDLANYLNKNDADSLGCCKDDERHIIARAGLCEMLRDAAEKEKEDAENERFDWLDLTCEAVEKLARIHGWQDASDLNGFSWNHAQTASRYITLEKMIEGEAGEENWQQIKVRVSDHGSAYCSEDFSIAKNPSGDDHTMGQLKAALENK